MKAAGNGFDPHTLAGAYALDAISDEGERRRFEQHLARCAECARETVTLRETAARLGVAVAVEPPPGLRERVLSEIDQVRQLPPEVPPAPHTRRPWRAWPAAVGMAAALAMVAWLGVTSVQVRQELQLAQRTEQRIAAVLSSDDARTVTGAVAGPSAGGGHGRGTVVMSRSQGALVFWAAGLGDPPAGRVYQLWQLAPGRITSAGLLVPSRSGGTLPVLSTIGSDVGQVGVTVEPTGGSRQPTSTPFLLLDLPAA